MFDGPTPGEIAFNNGLQLAREKRELEKRVEYLETTVALLLGATHRLEQLVEESHNGSS